MSGRTRLAFIAIPFQFAAAHALGYGVAAQLIVPGWHQMLAILVGNTIGITSMGLIIEGVLDVHQTRKAQRIAAAAAACLVGILIVSQLSTDRYEALLVPIALGVVAYHFSAFRSSFRTN